MEPAKFGVDSPILGRYEKLSKLGEGTYGIVFKAKDCVSQDYVALKKVKLENEKEGIPSTAIREISLLKEISHPSVVRLRDVVFNEEGNLFMVFDYAEYDLKKLISHYKKGLPAELVKSLLYQMLSGLCYCHSHRIMHRDLKPQNILVEKDGTLKLADFGLARAFGIPIRALTHEVVTLWYRAPEILLGKPDYSLSVDIWSVGCIFAEMAQNKVLFSGDSEIGQIFEIFRKLGTPDESVWPGVTKLKDYKSTFPNFRTKSIAQHVCYLDEHGLDLLKKMLVYAPEKRITAKAALLHPYFNGFDPKKQVVSSINTTATQLENN